MRSHHHVPQDLLQTAEPVLWGLDAWTALVGVVLVIVSFQLMTSASAALGAVVICLWATFLVVGFAAVDGISVRLLLTWAVVWTLHRCVRRRQGTEVATRLGGRT
ncbi:MAG: hypothetical protein ACYCOS_06440 [Sulfobacillus sp.]